jgi:hypothetical protein
MGLGRGVKIIEAMATGVPVIATDVGGVREFDFGTQIVPSAECGVRSAECSECGIK